LLSHRLWHYLRKNWGAPFVVAFMVLLIVSAIELSLGLSDSANGTAVYAFYGLVVGVALQIASYMKYGESTVEEQPLLQQPAARPREAPLFRTRRARVFATVVTVGVITGAAAIAFSFHLGSPPPLSSNISPVSVLQEPDGSRVVLLGMTASGGSLPYSFVAMWSDGFNQTSTTGVFQRNFSANQRIPSSVSFIVSSADGQTVKLTTVVKSNSTS
jgi:hypothetical protein